MTPIRPPGSRMTLACSLWTTIALPPKTWIDVSFAQDVFQDVRAEGTGVRILGPREGYTVARLQPMFEFRPDDLLLRFGGFTFTLGTHPNPYTDHSPEIWSRMDGDSPVPSTSIPGMDFKTLRVHMGGIIVRVPTTLPCVRVVMEVEG